MSLKKWGEQKNREMFEIWQKHFHEHKSGIEVFTSPLRENTPVILIGYNAGGGDIDAAEYNKYMDRFLEGEPDFSLPNTGHYEGDYTYPVAIRVRKYFFDGKQHLLEDAVETNRYFLRTDGKTHHNKVLDGVDERAETTYREFCRETNYEVIRRTNPSVVIDFSGEYFSEEFCVDLGFECEHRERHEYTDGSDTEAIVDIAEMTDAPNPTIISIKPHPSWPPMTQGQLDFFKRIIPPLLPE